MHDRAVIHETAEVSRDAFVGAGTKVWHQAQVREGARVGDDCTLGKNVYVDAGVTIGNRVKVQNNSSLFRPLVVEDGAFIGPHVIFTNDRLPRSITPDGRVKTETDWEQTRTTVRYGAAIGAGAIVLPGITIGRWALVGAGAVVTHDVPDRCIAVGNPAAIVGLACDCGRKLERLDRVLQCPICGRSFELAQR